jgi:hypothetical protein
MVAAPALRWRPNVASVPPAARPRPHAPPARPREQPPALRLRRRHRPALRRLSQAPGRRDLHRRLLQRAPLLLGRRARQLRRRQARQPHRPLRRAAGLRGPVSALRPAGDRPQLARRRHVRRTTRRRHRVPRPASHHPPPREPPPLRRRLPRDHRPPARPRRRRGPPPPRRLRPPRRHRGRRDRRPRQVPPRPPRPVLLGRQTWLPGHAPRDPAPRPPRPRGDPARPAPHPGQSIHPARRRRMAHGPHRRAVQRICPHHDGPPRRHRAPRHGELRHGHRPPARHTFTRSPPSCAPTSAT